MLAIIAGIIFFLLLYTGTGLLFPYRLLRSGRFFEDLLGAFWVGLALSIGFLQVWHLFAPVGVFSLIVLVCASLAGWGLNFKRVLSWLRTFSVKHILIATGLIAVPLFILSNEAIWGLVHFDHGLYHMPLVKWIESYAIVPGLGNLHHRFAFNNSSFLFAAQINSGVFTGLAYYIANTLLCFAVGLGCFNAIYHLAREDRPLSVADLYQVFLLPFLIFYISTAYFTGYSPDIFIFALEAVLAGELIRAFDRSITPEKDLLTRILILAALAITVKLSAVVFAGGIMLAVLGLFLAQQKKPKEKLIPRLSGWAGLIAAFIVPWLVRSVILSGYLVYPSPLISFNVLWKIPLKNVAPISGIIRQWAMYRSVTTPDISWLEWLKSWSIQIPFEVKEGIVYLVLILLAVLILRLRDRSQVLEWKGPAAVFGISFAAMVYWFLLAPDFRFSGAAYWLLVISAVVVLFQLIFSLHWVKSPNVLVGIILFVIMFWLAPRFNNNISPATFLVPNLETSIAQKAMDSDVTPTQVTRSGLVVNMANDGSKEACWDEPLPCTRVNDFEPRLALIDPLNMQKGFFLQP
jgi:hypothetical protein